MLELVTLSDMNLCSSAVVGLSTDLEQRLEQQPLLDLSEILFNGFRTCFEVYGLEQRPQNFPP